MVQASLPRPTRGRALVVATSLLVLLGMTAGPLNSNRVEAQAKKGDAKDAKSDPKAPGDLKTGVVAGSNDVIVGGGVEQIAYINQQLADKWQANKLRPADRCTDYEFIRRATLDLIGRIAEPKEIREFLNWPSELRRSKLVDKLLKGEECANNIANIYTNLLMTRTGPKRHHEQMQAWLTEEFFKSDANWARIATSLISASGKENGDNDAPAVNFILVHLGDEIKGNSEESGRYEMVPVTSRITRLFLGLRTQCTQCHNHPFNDEWKQENFWGINAYLRQVDTPGGRPVNNGKKKDGKPQIHSIVDNPNFNRSMLVLL